MKKSIRNFNISGKKVIIRSDLNVPIQDDQITDDIRIRRSIETIRYAIKQKAKVIVLSHLGRIKTEEDKEKNNLEIVAKRLQELLDSKVTFVPQTRGEMVENAVSHMKEGEVIVLQNTRYEDLNNKSESHCDEELAKYWAGLGDIYINDAFGTLHRKHASNVGISKYLPSGIGFLVEKEIASLDELKDPEHPFVIMLGGAKVEDKIHLIENLIPKCDKLLIGGGMAFTFLQADGYEVGNSLVDKTSLDFCQNLLKKYPMKIVLPLDIVCCNEYRDMAGKVRMINEIQFDEMGLDIGPQTVELFEKHLNDAKMVLWNGPMGVYEFDHYAKGTDAILSYVEKHDIKTIVAGGDIVAAATKNHIADHLYHVSTGGGATLSYLEGALMPGLENIEEV